MGGLAVCFLLPLGDFARMALAGETKTNLSPPTAATDMQPITMEPISPVPLQVELDQKKVELGRMLFNDSRLSSGNGLSCASCHVLQRALADGQPISAGVAGDSMTTNTLTLFNVGLNQMLGWNGQTTSLEEQAEGVVKRRMGGDWNEIVSTLGADSGMRAAFGEIYNDGLTRNNIISALVEYEKSLDTPNAPFDRYLRGDQNALSADAKAGYQLFKDYGCASCHQGVNVGGNMFQVFGIFGTPDAAENGALTEGSAQDTGIADDRPVFRVPSLRNVQHTGPYFHDGSVSTLPEAIGIMAQYQLGRDISKEEILKIQAFLDSLTGEYKGTPIGHQ
ncbi:cytochrome c peroxidase [Mesorhizobium sp.]|uniref:cytochrome-c peroxidase n=1 Tax=Mesorhizobium sp. TaxID=1871066 RepID=UPI0026009311|nr:cytochrome c peroxidase [Mesorhizobium sp.]